MTVPVLKGPRLTLRAPCEGDAQDRYSLGQHPEIVHMFGGELDTALSFALEDAAAQIAGLEKHSHGWVVVFEQRMIGEIRLDAMDDYDRKARLAVGLYDPTKLGLGLGREAINLVLAYAFDTLKLHRVGLRVLAYNERAIRCYRACHFVEEGREREAAFVGGKWHDEVLMSVLVHEFEAAQKTLS